MKNIYDSFCGGLKAWPILRGVCAFALIVSFGEFLVLAITGQFTGIELSVRNIKLLVWHLHMPFGISRLWDVILLPPFIYLSFKNEERRESRSFEEMGRDDGYYGEKVMDLIQMSLCGAMLGSSIFGIVYAIPMFIATYVLGVLIDILISLAEGLPILSKELWKCMFRSNAK